MRQLNERGKNIEVIKKNRNLSNRENVKKKRKGREMGWLFKRTYKKNNDIEEMRGEAKINTKRGVKDKVTTNW